MALAQEREARRIEEERRQLQLLKEAQEKRRKIDSVPRFSVKVKCFEVVNLLLLYT